jgi:HK97 family phage portal protein
MFLAAGDLDPAKRGPGDDFWYYPVGRMTAAGVRVSPATAIAITAVYACVQVLGQTLGVVPLHLYRRLDKGGKDRAAEHPLYQVLHRRPNRWQTSFQWRQMLEWHLGLRGNAYSEIRYGRRQAIEELVPLHPDRMRVETVEAAGERTYRYRYTERGGRERVLVRGEILHLRGLVADGIEGLSPIEAQSESFGEARAAQIYSARVLANDARPNGIIEMESHFKDPEAKKTFKQSWKEAQGGINRGEVAVLEHGMKWRDIGLKSADLQLIELRKMKSYDVCGAYRMPPHKIGLMERATFSNIEHQGIEFVTDTMLPWYVNWEQELSAQLLQGDDAEELFFEFLVDGMLRGDSQARSNYYGKMFQTGAMSPNDIRERENQNPIEGGDRRFVPSNMMPLDRVDAVVDRSTIDRGGRQQRDDERREQNGERENELARAAAERVVRKEAAALRRLRSKTAGNGAFAEEAEQFYREHGDFVAEVMAVGNEAAMSYVAMRMDRLHAAIGDDGVEQFVERIEASGARQLLDLASSIRH